MHVPRGRGRDTRCRHRLPRPASRTNHVNAARRWRRDLDAWAIPAEILAAAEESPWIHPTVLFDVPDVIAPSPSHDRAREALGAEGSVLDIGCGGGVAAMALAPDVKRVIGIDHQSEMLTMFERNARARGLECATIDGRWPDVERAAPIADVVTAHHVAYNVGDIVPFIVALNLHARHRVVLEMSNQHPMTDLDDAWRHFWKIERPVGPTPDDLVRVLDEMDINASLERWDGPARSMADLEEAAHFLRVRLCLPSSRESEVREYLADHPAPTKRPLATLWWTTT